jgi:hypothetical protein
MSTHFAHSPSRNHAFSAHGQHTRIMSDTYNHLRRDRSFMEKPETGWLHEDDAMVAGDEGIYYSFPLQVSVSGCRTGPSKQRAGGADVRDRQSEQVAGVVGESATNSTDLRRLPARSLCARVCGVCVPCALLCVCVCVCCRSISEASSSTSLFAPSMAKSRPSSPGQSVSQ